MNKNRKSKSEYEEKVVQVDRVARTMKGGRRISFRALVVLGDKKGKVGFAIGKGREVAIAIEKAKKRAKKQMIKVKIVKDTIPHSISIKFGSARLMLKPAPAGTSVIAGGAVRAVVEAAGIKNVVGKIFGSANKINNVKACFIALKKISNSQMKYINNNHEAPSTPSGKK